MKYRIEINKSTQERKESTDICIACRVDQAAGRSKRERSEIDDRCHCDPKDRRFFHGMYHLDLFRRAAGGIKFINSRTQSFLSVPALTLRSYFTWLLAVPLTVPLQFSPLGRLSPELLCPPRLSLVQGFFVPCDYMIAYMYMYFKRAKQPNIHVRFCAELYMYILAIP